MAAKVIPLSTENIKQFELQSEFALSIYALDYCARVNLSTIITETQMNNPNKSASQKIALSKIILLLHNFVDPPTPAKFTTAADEKTSTYSDEYVAFLTTTSELVRHLMVLENFYDVLCRMQIYFGKDMLNAYGNNVMSAEEINQPFLFVLEKMIPFFNV